MSKKIYWFATVAVSFGLLFAVACGGSKKSDTKPAAKSNDPVLKEVQSALTNFGTLKSYQATFAAQNKNAQGAITSTAFTYDVVPPDKYQLYTGPTANITRVVGNETFSYDRPTDKWTLLTDYSGAAYDGLNNLFDPKTMKAISDSLGDTASVTKGATDTVDGKTCQLFVLTDKETNNKTDMCIADNLPVKFVYHTGELSTTATFGKFNSGVPVDRPKTN